MDSTTAERLDALEDRTKRVYAMLDRFAEGIDRIDQRIDEMFGRLTGAPTSAGKESTSSG